MDYDYIVVGAGSSGCALAGRLARHLPSARIALIESGPGDDSALVTIPAALIVQLPFRSKRNYAYQTVPQHGLNQRRGYQPRGRGLGGSSSINAMVYVRGHPDDYDSWARLGCDGWGWSDVLPYFMRSEHNERGADAWHGTGGLLNVADARSPHPFAALFLTAAHQTGFASTPDFNGARQEGVGYYQVTQKQGERWNAARAFLHSAHLPNVAILTGAIALRIVFDGKRASGVCIVRDGIQSVLSARAEIILAAGTFGSPQLLLCSGIGPAEQLKQCNITPVHHAPGVGQNLQDHPDYIRSVRVKNADTLGISLRGTLRLLRALLRYRNERTGMLTSNGAEAGGFFKTDPALAHPDIQMFFVLGMLDDHGRKQHWGHGYSCHVSVLHPKSRGTLTLASPDMRCAPIIDPGFLSATEDVDTMLQGITMMNRILAAPALSALGGQPVRALPDSEAAWRAEIRQRTDTAYHPIGTCRMGKDALAVVDPRLRVYGVHGLRVADASVMPTLIGGNTHAAAVMIGERAADWLAQTHLTST
ncbi:GMC family oxidoreductase [Glaciimonas sp. GG7]